MVLFFITLATLLAGVGSVWLAGLLARSVLSRHTAHLLSLAAGALMATAFTHLLPEAFESGVGAHALFATLLGGLIFFFLLDKAELYHHGHEHHHHHPDSAELTGPSPDAHAHSAAHQHALSPQVVTQGRAHPPHAHHTHGEHDGHEAHHGHHHASGGWPVLLGDGIHAFGDGVLIAAAFMAGPALGLAASLAVLAHEMPHHVSDLVVLQQSSSARRALFLASVAGSSAVLGGWLGYWLIDTMQSLLPYLLTLAASSFIYVALADLIPQLQKRLSARETAEQIAWLGAGLAMVVAVYSWMHGGH